MTKFQKQMLTIAAAGALTAVTALPAMAFENQFNGTFAVKTFLSNFDNGASAVLPGAKNTKTSNYTEQRTRLRYTAKASDDLKLVTHFELDTRWGNTAASGDNGGGGIDADGINIQTKWAYLDFNMGKSVNVKAGLMPYKDNLKGLYLDADMPMAYMAYKAGGYTLGLGYSRFNDAAASLSNKDYFGNKSSDLFVLDNTYAISKDTKLGMAYFMNIDNNQAGSGVANGKEKKVHTLGLYGETKMGDLSLSGFAAMQAGYQKNVVGTTTQNYHGWAANTVAKMKVGTGLARAGFLFTSGNNNGSNTAQNRAWQTVSYQGTNATAVQNTYSDSGMMLLVRNPGMGGTSTDGYFRKPITNIALAHIGYDANITDKLYTNGNVGFAWLPASDYLLTNPSGSPAAALPAATTNPNGSDFMGTEMNLEVGYKLYKNLTLKAQAAYVVLGGAFKDKATATGGDPANPFSMRMGAHYSF